MIRTAHQGPIVSLGLVLLLLLFVQADGFLAAARPRIQGITQAGAHLIIRGTSGIHGESYHVLAATNLALPAAQWTRLATHTFGPGGVFSFTNALTPAASHRFYMIQPIPSSACLEQLNALGIAWAWGPESPGVALPVTVTLPLGEMRFRFIDGTLRESWFMDCELALALHRMARLLAARGVVEVVDFGIYNYRCIGGGVPPDCPQGLSMHAKALAVDVAGLVTGDLGLLSVEDDWVIDADGNTCATRSRGRRDAFLHAALCDLHAAGIFTIHLSPNFNSDHPDHWRLLPPPGPGRVLR
ncbi:MAG TPA: extensin family protein [Verrucomicrobiota bacterium]|nr:extensin family protein [Verrucomicrobiota bacterium]